jgi:hypothetical protein
MFFDGVGLLCAYGLTVAVGWRVTAGRRRRWRRDYGGAAEMSSLHAHYFLLHIYIIFAIYLYYFCYIHIKEDFFSYVHNDFATCAYIGKIICYSCSMFLLQLATWPSQM